MKTSTVALVALAGVFGGLGTGACTSAGGGGGSGATGGGGATGAGGSNAGASGGGAAGSGGATGGAGAAGSGNAGAAGGGNAGAAGAGTAGQGAAGNPGVSGSAGGQAQTAGASGTLGTGGGSAWSCPPASTLLGNPIPAGATPTRLAMVPPHDSFNGNGASYGNIEGPVWNGDALYVSELGNGALPPLSRILRVTLDGMVSIQIADSGSNGLALDGKGGLLSANHKVGGIVDFTNLSVPSGMPVDGVTMYNGTRFSSPNDIARRSDGNIYFSDPDYQAGGTKQPQTRVYRVAPGATTATVVDATRMEPNGVTLSLDENTLYVCSTVDGIFKYPVAQDGSVGAGTKVTSDPGDGMVMDCAGNLYVAARGLASPGVIIINPSTGATVAGPILVEGVLDVTNLAFGGPDHKTLFITALGTGSQMGLFKMTMSFPGMPY